MPTKSRAAILVESRKPLVVDEVTFPDPAPDQVLVKLFASGICHSQLHQIQRTPEEQRAIDLICKVAVSMAEPVAGWSATWGVHDLPAAPIVGPAVAAIWGWLPALLWIFLGVILMGAAHDFGALVVSMKHKGHSIAVVAEKNLGPRVRNLMLIVIFFLVWMVI